MEFQAYDRPLETVTPFKHPGILLTVTYYDWLSVTNNLQKAHNIWEIMLGILGLEGAENWTAGRF